MNGRAAIYVRAKTRQEKWKQIFTARMYALKYRVKVVQIYWDCDTGDEKAGKRPAFGRLLIDLRKGDYKFIIVADLTTITRQFDELERILFFTKSFDVNFEIPKFEKECKSFAYPFDIKK